MLHQARHVRTRAFAIVLRVREPVEQIDTVRALRPVVQCQASGQFGRDRTVFAGPTVQAGIHIHAMVGRQLLELLDLDIHHAAAERD